MLKIVTWPDIQRVAASMRDIQRKAALALCGSDDIMEAIMPLATSPTIGATVWKGDEPIVAIGVVLVHPGVGSTFMYSTDRWREVLIETTRFFKRGLVPGLVRAGIHRIQALGLAGDPQTDRWKVLLGATHSAELRSYGKNGEDYVLHSMVFPRVTSAPA